MIFNPRIQKNISGFDWERIRRAQIGNSNVSSTSKTDDRGRPYIGLRIKTDISDPIAVTEFPSYRSGNPECIIGLFAIKYTETGVGWIQSAWDVFAVTTGSNGDGVNFMSWGRNYSEVEYSDGYLTIWLMVDSRYVGPSMALAHFPSTVRGCYMFYEV